MHYSFLFGTTGKYFLNKLPISLCRLRILSSTWLQWKKYYTNIKKLQVIQKTTPIWSCRWLVDKLQGTVEWETFKSKICGHLDDFMVRRCTRDLSIYRPSDTKDLKCFLKRNTMETLIAPFKMEVNSVSPPIVQVYFECPTRQSRQNLGFMVLFL